MSESYFRPASSEVGGLQVQSNPELFAPYAHTGFPATPELRAYVLTYYVHGRRTRVVHTAAVDRAEARGRAVRIAERTEARMSFLVSAVPARTAVTPAMTQPTARYPGSQARRRRGQLLAAGAVTAVMFTGGAGFLFGALGVGAGVLQAAAMVAPAGVVVSLASTGRLHCPGCRGWSR